MPGFLTAQAVLRGRVHQLNQHLGVLSGNAVVHVRLFAQPDRKQGLKRLQIRATRTAKLLGLVLGCIEAVF